MCERRGAGERIESSPAMTAEAGEEAVHGEAIREAKAQTPASQKQDAACRLSIPFVSR
jgi:hypothetical protein